MCFILCMCVCRGLRTVLRSRLSPITLKDQSLDSGPQDCSHVPLPTEAPHCPCFFDFKCDWMVSVWELKAKTLTTSTDLMSQFFFWGGLLFCKIHSCWFIIQTFMVERILYFHTPIHSASDGRFALHFFIINRKFKKGYSTMDAEWAHHGPSAVFFCCSLMHKQALWISIDLPTQ